MNNPVYINVQLYELLYGMCLNWCEVNMNYMQVDFVQKSVCEEL